MPGDDGRAHNPLATWDLKMPGEFLTASSIWPLHDGRHQDCALLKFPVPSLTPPSENLFSFPVKEDKHPSFEDPRESYKLESRCGGGYRKALSRDKD